jgi:hypothetical protein
VVRGCPDYKAAKIKEKKTTVRNALEGIAA